MLQQIVEDGGQSGLQVSAATSLSPFIDELRAKLDAVEQQLTTSAGRRLSAVDVRAILKVRAARKEHFPAELFADPAWDLLLELYAVELGQQKVSVSNLCLTAGVPATTALRWIGNLERAGLIVRNDDLFDRRRVWVRLSQAGLEAMDRYFRSAQMRVPSSEPLLGAHSSSSWG